MKVVKSMTMITGAKASEEALNKAETKRLDAEMKRLEKSIPEGHPLKEEIEKQKSLVGDLSGLPPGHPLLVGLAQSKERYEKTQESKTTDGEDVELKKVRKIDTIERKAKRVARQQESDGEDRRFYASKNVNKRVEETLSSVKNLWSVLNENEEILNTHPIGRTRVMRLKRLLFAMERGLTESKIPRM